MTAVQTLTAKRWTVEEYHRMGELGLISSDERTELIDGEIITSMSPMGTRHSGAVFRVTEALKSILGANYYVDDERAIHLNDHSEPQPDVFVAQGACPDYDDHHPRPEELLLVVEVSDSTLGTDRSIKTQLYADSAIQEYWIVNLPDQCVEVYRRPEPGRGYLEHITHLATDVVSPLVAPGARIPVSDLLPRL